MLHLMLWQTSHVLVHHNECVGMRHVSKLCLPTYLVEQTSDYWVGQS